MEVHVEGRGHAAGEQFKDGEAGQGVEGVGVEPGLAGEDLLKEPVVQGQPSAKERRKTMGLCVCAFLKPGMTRSPPRSSSRSKCGASCRAHPT